MLHTFENERQQFSHALLSLFSFPFYEITVFTTAILREVDKNTPDATEFGKGLEKTKY